MIFQEVKELLQGVRPYFYNYSQPVKVYLHWTAGDYNTTFDDYHFCITGDGHIKNTRDLKTIPAATYQRNTGSIAIALCCCAGAEAFAGTPNYARLGSYPPTAAQIESCARLMAIIADVFDVNINIYHFLTHGEAADCMDSDFCHESYGMNTTCERWDLAVLKDSDEWGSGGDILRSKAIWYQKNGG